MPQSYSRRRLLQTLGLSLGAAALPVSAWATNEQGQPLLLPHAELHPTPARPVTAITLGAGNRGNVYGNYALQYPEQLDIIGVAEPIPLRNERYAQKHKIAADRRFTTWEQVFGQPKMADAVIISTPDDLHFGPCMQALDKGYDILLEKPISPSEAECRAILAKAKTTGRIVAVCHVLRYAPYFEALQEIIRSGVLGEVVSVQHFEPIEHIHMSHSFVRGNWHNSRQTAPIILAKSCHDMDILRWLLGVESRKVQAFGHLSWFRKEKAPAGSTARCSDGCAVEGQCPYSALKIYYRDRTYNYVFDLPEKKEEQAAFVLEQLKTTNYGRCVYRMENDQPDHYIANLLFDRNITASFSMEAFTSYHGRRTRIMGTLGDVVGDMTKFVHTDFLTRKATEWKQSTDGHGGGDWRLVANFVQAVARQDGRLLTSTIEASIESHLMAFAAERSRLNGTVEMIG
ncbi:MAG TPA: Gfo/Idh/MocA family oxidoreductase [Lacibacter sp.]|nr:Gfo/Idh/MocA family oxidoreductase [Lacibacter sp.]HMO88200.1 Gfo/Idh/MocA family oxidoreductase [Lacibacter sp.]HMP86700.1 Gfo/Idh/MocA family oxidoreductase [Lacibacter sp.]